MDQVEHEDECESESSEEGEGGSSSTSGNESGVEIVAPSTSLTVGGLAKHELLGTVKILQLSGNEPWHERKTLVELPPAIGRRKQATQRWVFTDALAVIPNSSAVCNPLSCLGSSSSARTHGTSSSDVADALDERIEGLASPPPRAEIERQRKVRRLKSATNLKRGRRSKMGTRVTKEPKVDPSDRVLQFPNHSLRISNGKLFCNCCTTELSLRKISVRQHVIGKQHLHRLEEWIRKSARQEATVELLTEERNKNPDERGGCLSPELQEFRFATVRTAMGVGIPLEKIDGGLGSLLNRAGLKVGSASDLRGYIPLVRNAELELLKRELKDEWMCVVFDGTTRLGEVIAVVVRYCTEDFNLKYRLIALTTTETHTSGASLSGLLCRILVQRVGDQAFDRVIAAARDSCATNGVALRSLKATAMPRLMDVMCFSHTLHNCAKHMRLECLDQWLSSWFTLMAHSHAAKSLWRKRIDTAPVLFSKVRWWSRFECAMQLAKFFSSLDPRRFRE